MVVTEQVPMHLAAVVQAAVDWVNVERDSGFTLTGLVDAEAITNLSEPFELGLVLCDGELCGREQVQVLPEDGTYTFRFTPQAALNIPPLLDPPEGIRRDWLARQLAKYEFVVLLYYRGLW